MSRLASILILREDVPSTITRMWDPSNGYYGVLNSVMVSNLSPTAPATVVCKTPISSQTIGSLPNSSHVGKIVVPPNDSVQLLDAALMLDEGESLCLSQDGASLPVSVRVNGFVYSYP